MALLKQKSWRLRSCFNVITVSLILIFLVPLHAHGTSDEQYFHWRGLRVSKWLPPSRKELESLVRELRISTGFTELHFEGSGQLVLGDRERLVGGSKAARELLLAAVDSPDVFILESATHSRSIAFAEIEPTDVYFDPENVRHEVWRVRLDFSDFVHLRGSDRAIAALGPAMTFMHELAHGVLKMRDSITAVDQLGECERHINLIRAELGLPQRERYEPRSWRGVSPGSSGQSLQAEFKLSIIDEESNKKKTYHLAFDVDRVCDIEKVKALPPGRPEIFVATR
jgi:hypothetical protein